MIERLLPVARERKISLDLPTALTASDIATAVGHVIEAATSEQITPGEAHSLAGLFELQRRAFETTELERRIAALETEKAA